jgi:hypothetical protein
VKAGQIARQRLRNQGLAASPFATCEDVVCWMAAVQAQEHASAPWSLLQRAAGTTPAALDRALAEGAILRTHVLRPTWHFVLREDIRWLLELTAPRIRAALAHADRWLGIDAVRRRRGISAIAAALVERGHLSRVELAHVLRRARVAEDARTVAHVAIHAELDAVVCSGAPRGAHQTYALLEERAPRAASLPRDEALAELARRYFRSRGPATLRDFRWWSGLAAADAARALAMVSAELERVEAEGRTYWHDPSRPSARAGAPTAHLLQAYDEYVVAYSESRDVLEAPGAAGAAPRAIPYFPRAVIVDGRIVGHWRSPRSRTASVEIEPFGPLTAAHRTAVERAVRRHGRMVESRGPRMAADAGRDR